MGRPTGIPNHREALPFRDTPHLERLQPNVAVATPHRGTGRIGENAAQSELGGARGCPQPADACRFLVDSGFAGNPLAVLDAAPSPDCKPLPGQAATFPAIRPDKCVCGTAEPAAD